MAAQQQIDLHASRGELTLVLVTLFPALATLIVLLRVYTRFIVLRTPALDDAFILLALTFAIGMCVSQVFEVKNGMGRHIAALTKSQIADCFKALYACIILYNIGLTFVKVSILLQYLRICITRLSKRCCYAVLAFIIAYGIMTTFTSLFTCTPIAFFWNPHLPGGGTCVNKTRLYFANAAINIFTDFALLFLPALILKHLLMPTSQKLIVTVILAFGGLGCIASILRLHSLYIATHSTDPTWDKTGTVYWSAIELNVGIICASMTTLRPLASRMFPKTFGTNKSTPRPSYVMVSAGKYSIGFSKTEPSVNLGSSTEGFAEA